MTQTQPNLSPPPTSPPVATAAPIGYEACECGKYAHIFRAEVLRRLPAGYSGELCRECNLWMCAIEYLKAKGITA